MMGYAHVDGELCPSREATVSIRDRGFMYGDAVFETLRVYGGTIFAWEDHAERLAHSCEQLSLKHEITATDLRSRIHQTLQANELENAYVKLSLTRGVQPGRLTPAHKTDPTVVIRTEALPRGGVAGDSVWERPAECVIPAIRRPPVTSMPATAKTHNYLNGILARIAARDAGVDEALLLDTAGALTEGATCNLFFTEGETIHTPTVDEKPILPGITRKYVISMARSAGFSVETSVYEPQSLATADEVFLTNTTWEIRPVTTVDDWSYPSGRITAALASAFDERIESDCY